MITPEFLLVLLVAAALALALVLVWALVLERRLRAVQQQVTALEDTLQRSAECYQGLSAGAVGQGQHLVRVRQDLVRVKERLDQVANNDPSGSSFNQAIRMAQRGSSAEEIMETCGISQVEADLVLLLHREGGC